MTIALDKTISGASAREYGYSYTYALERLCSVPIISDPEPVNLEIRNGRIKKFRTMRDLINELDS